MRGEGHGAGSKVTGGLTGVAVAPHSSLSSWGERGPQQTKAKADGVGVDWGREGPSKEAVSCLQMKTRNRERRLKREKTK